MFGATTILRAHGQPATDFFGLLLAGGVEPYIVDQAKRARRQQIGPLARLLQAERPGRELAARREDRRSTRNEAKPPQHERGNGEFPVEETIKHQNVMRIGAHYR